MEGGTVLLGLKKFFNQQEDIQSVIAGIEEGLREQLVTGLSGSARSLFLASVYGKTKKPILIVTHNLLQAQKMFDDLVQIIGDEDVFLYPANELIGAEISVASPELKAQRIEVLNNLVHKKKAYHHCTNCRNEENGSTACVWKRYQLTFKVGQEVMITDELNRFVEMGYGRTDMITAPGEFSVRGGIIDIYPLTEQRPDSN